MTEVFDQCFTFFTQMTDIWDRFSYLLDYKLEIMSVVFALAMFVGFYIYRLYFAVTFFYIYVTLCVLVLPRFLNWHLIVAFFSVSGVIFSFLIYKCNRLGGLLLCTVIGGMIGYIVMPASFMVVIFALMGLAICFYFPVHGICLYMGLFGGLGLSSLFYFPDYLGVAVGILCGIFQLVITGNQNLFPNKYPAKIQYLLDKKRIKA